MAVRTISTALKLEGEAEYKRQMAGVNAELKTLSTELKLAEAQFKGQANSLDALTAKDALLRKEIGLTNRKLEEAEGALREAREVQAQFADAMEAVKKKAQDAGVPLEKLRGNAEDLTQEEQALARELSNAERGYDMVTKKVQGYQQTVNRTKTDLLRFNGELEDTDRYLDEAKASADHTASSIDGLGREVKDAAGKLGDLKQDADNAADGLDDLKDQAQEAGDGLGGMDFGGLAGKLKDLKGILAGGAVIGGVKALTGAITEIEESTREYRKIMGTLETSSAQAGYAAEETEEAYRRLHGVLGDSQTSATAIANLQAIGLSQENLISMVDSCTGAWATYGDSIPIDSLAESINETIKAGQVTGTFADVLNWGSQEGETFGVKMRESTEANQEWNTAVENCKTAEDFFNLALQDCQTETEKADLVMQAMAKQGLAETGEKWRDNNEQIIAMNESEGDLEAAMGHLGDVLSPAADALKTFAAEGIEVVAQALEGAVDWFGKLTGKMDDASKKARDVKRELSYVVDEETGKAAGGFKGTGRGPIRGSHAAGLDRVPYDGYLAELHADEAVLNAREARVWRAFRDAPSVHTPPAAEERTEPEALLPVTLVVKPALNQREIGEAVTTYQLRVRKARGQ